MPPIIKSWSSSLSQLSIGNQRSRRNVLGVKYQVHCVCNEGRQGRSYYYLEERVKTAPPFNTFKIICNSIAPMVRYHEQFINRVGAFNDK